MKTIFYSVFAILLLTLTSCGKDDIELVSPEYKNINVSSSGVLEIPVLTSDWSIESVRSLGVSMIDEKNNPLALEGFGKIEAANKWFALERKEDTKFTVYLKENFGDTMRDIVICINNNGDRDYVTIEQSRGESYRLVEKSFQEIEALREVYMSDNGCHRQVFTNYSSEPIWLPTNSVFSDVVYTTEFESDDYGAFDWVSPGEELEIILPDILIDGMLRANKSCIYKPGVSTRPNTPNENKLLIPAHTTLYLSGEVEYCKRHFNYVFTIENEKSGLRFDIKGTCLQISPIVESLISSDKEE